MRRLFLCLSLLALACGSKDSSQVVLIHVNCTNVPGVVALNLTLSNGGVSDSHRYVSKTPLTTTSLTATMPSSRSGVVDIAIDGFDDDKLVIAHGTGTVTVQPGVQADTTVVLAAVVSPSIDAGPPADAAADGATGGSDASSTDGSTDIVWVGDSGDGGVDGSGDGGVDGSGDSAGTIGNTTIFKGEATGYFTGSVYPTHGGCDTVTSWSSDTALCVSGRIPARPPADCGTTWGIEAALELSGKPSKTFSTIAFKFAGIPSTGVRAVLYLSEDAAYCYDNINSGDRLDLAKFNAGCWNGTGESFSVADVTKIQTIALQIPSSTQDIAVTNFCLEEIDVQ